jgi:hypothetical protein
MPNDTKSPAIPLHSHIHRFLASATWQDLNFPERIHQQLIEITKCVVNRPAASPATSLPTWQSTRKERSSSSLAHAAPRKPSLRKYSPRVSGSSSFVSISVVHSKHIGDTEKNLDRLFETAQASGAMPLID